MSSNVGLTTPRGSGTSGYVQRNSAFIKPRSTGSGAPYPPLGSGPDRGFKQRVPDKQILEHDRRRAIEVKVMEERERLEEENERIEEECAKKNKKKDTTEEGEEDESEEKILTEEEIDERCEALRAKLIKEMEESGSKERDAPRRKWDLGSGSGSGNQRDRRLKSYQVHELAEAKIQESERLRRALGIREDRETGEISSQRAERRPRD
ncbi:mRNA splicing factor Cwf21 [Penicillium malachiteum]|uniref:mRNA splicing factor Cwf21 n=1 Tax=Penicillium malachiteum TaxID=1324776 RepID=UPI002549A4AE|nr:mRNA splicing factor Cwf21 [Penicillium malachiteum]KAJ5720981.1 mRNA splicing factor Cwf21 [Penicillium malachiteum]